MPRFFRDFFGNEAVQGALLALAVVVLDTLLNGTGRNR